MQLEYLMADLANASHTLWNAEDIYMSLVATKVGMLSSAQRWTIWYTNRCESSRSHC